MSYLGKKGLIIYSVVFIIFVLTIIILAFYYAQFKVKILTPTKDLWQEIIYHPNPQLWQVKLDTKIFSDPRFLNLENNFVNLHVSPQYLGSQNIFISEQKNSSLEQKLEEDNNSENNNSNLQPLQDNDFNISAEEATSTENKQSTSSGPQVEPIEFY